MSTVVPAADVRQGDVLEPEFGTVTDTYTDRAGMTVIESDGHYNLPRLHPEDGVVITNNRSQS